jgi:hypothetical protein
MSQQGGMVLMGRMGPMRRMGLIGPIGPMRPIRTMPRVKQQGIAPAAQSHEHTNTTIFQMWNCVIDCQSVIGS